jgi:hypothetical protein
MKKGEHVHVSTTVCPIHGSYMDLRKLLIKDISILDVNFTRKIRYSTFILFNQITLQHLTVKFITSIL